MLDFLKKAIFTVLTPGQKRKREHMEGEGTSKPVSQLQLQAELRQQLVFDNPADQPQEPYTFREFPKSAVRSGGTHIRGKPGFSVKDYKVPHSALKMQQPRYDSEKAKHNGGEHHWMVQQVCDVEGFLEGGDGATYQPPLGKSTKGDEYRPTSTTLATLLSNQNTAEEVPIHLRTEKFLDMATYRAITQPDPYIFDRPNLLDIEQIFKASLRLEQTQEEHEKKQREAEQIAAKAQSSLSQHFMFVKQKRDDANEREKLIKEKIERELKNLKKQTVTKDNSKVLRPFLKPGWLDTFKSVTGKSGAPSEVLLTDPVSKIEIRRHDMRTLAFETWLNDEIINVYMSLIVQRAARGNGALPRVHCFNSFFASKLYIEDGYNYGNVRRWTLPVRLRQSGQLVDSILDLDRIIVPINLNNTHWTCAVIDLRGRKFEYYDSMGGRNARCLESLAAWLKDEYMNKRKEDRSDVLEWPREYPAVPAQSNCSDCGMFSLVFAEYASRGAEFTFKQKDIRDFRVQVCNEIVELQLV